MGEQNLLYIYQSHQMSTTANSTVADGGLSKGRLAGEHSEMDPESGGRQAPWWYRDHVVKIYWFRAINVPKLQRVLPVLRPRLIPLEMRVLLRTESRKT